jgi:hypothetical protein
MKQLTQKKLLLLLVALVLGVGLLCALYGAYRFTAMFRYPNSSVKDVNIRIARSSPGLFCLSVSSLMMTEDQSADVRSWYYQQGWKTSAMHKDILEWQPIPNLDVGPAKLGPVRISWQNGAACGTKTYHELTEIETRSTLCIYW